jgi:hypothetical protein
MEVQGKNVEWGDALYSPERLRVGVMPRDIHSGLQKEEVNDTCVYEWKQSAMT